MTQTSTSSNGVGRNGHLANGHGQPDKEERLDKRSLSILILVLIIDLIAFTAILPLFPSILDFYSRRHSSGGEVG